MTAETLPPPGPSYLANLVKRILFMVVLSLAIRLLSGCAAMPVEGPTAASVVLIRDGVRNCGGVATGPRTIMTAAHCVDDLPLGAGAKAVQEIATAEDWEAHGTSSVRLAAVLSRDDGADVAVLYVEGTEDLPAWVETAAAGLAPRVTLVRAREYYWRWHTETTTVGYMNTVICKGDSGSGVFDSDGRLIGIQITLFTNTAQCARGGMWRPLGVDWGLP